MGVIIDDPELRERKYIFSDRHDAGKHLGKFLLTRPAMSDPVVLAIPAGGVPVGAEIARFLDAPLVLAITRKIQIPGSTEAGFGAVTWDGKVLVNERLRAALLLSQAQVDTAIASAKRNVEDRVARFTGGKSFPDLAKKCVIVTDDGLASGFTVLAALASIRTRHPDRIIVAVPTASASSADLVARQADELVCLNIRSGFRFAVAEAYKHWYDLDDREVLSELASVKAL